MILATAGHVDHGKTLLVKALTGIDTDRLPEEKRRGMTIDLGFVTLQAGTGPSIGIIDVPGHERFIHNMLCGVTGTDFVLLVVAADDGPMPQTIEHLAILDLLDIQHAAVALTKIDRVGPDRPAQVVARIADILQGTSLAGSPIFPVSALSGAGIAELKDHLLKAAAALPPRRERGNFRLAVDRSFNLPGTGLIVTGTVLSGAIAEGQQATVLLSGAKARIRSIHAHNCRSSVARAGQRCAFNLVGAELRNRQVERGDWIVDDLVMGPVQKVDAILRVSRSRNRDIAHWTPVHVHIGAANVTGRVATLEAASIRCGESGLVQLVLDHPVGACHGDRFILRDQSAKSTIGGGRVVDLYPPSRGRARPERLQFLRAMSAHDDRIALRELLDISPGGVGLEQFIRCRNLSPAEASALIELSQLRLLKSGHGTVAILPDNWEALKATALEALAEWHRREPESIGPSDDRLLSRTQVRVEPWVAREVAIELSRAGKLLRQGVLVRLPEHKPTMDRQDAGLWQRIAPLLEEARFHPPTIRLLSKATGEQESRLEAVLVRAARRGDLVRISPKRFLLNQAVRALAEAVQALAGASPDGLVSIAAFRARTGLGRNVTIEILELFDRLGFTQRVGEARQVLRRVDEVIGEAPDCDGSAPGL